MHAIPQHTRHLLERLLEAYCARICPPTARNTVLIGYRIEEDRVWIDELRRICGVPGTRRSVPVARFRYRASDGCWLLDQRDEAGRWRRHRALAPTRSFLELLREVEPEDLIKFGLIPELVGRLPVVATLDELSEEALVEILVEPKNALLRQFKKFFHFEPSHRECITEIVKGNSISRDRDELL